jgi:hypothetical protein
LPASRRAAALHRSRRAPATPVGALSPAQDVAFVVDTFDRFGNRRHVGGADLRVAVSGPSHVAPPTAHVRDNADGSYSVRYAPRAPGLHRVGVTVGSAHIQGSEFDVEVRQDWPTSAPGLAHICAGFWLGHGAVACAGARRGCADELRVRRGAQARDGGRDGAL